MLGPFLNAPSVSLSLPPPFPLPIDLPCFQPPRLPASSPITTMVLCETSRRGLSRGQSPLLLNLSVSLEPTTN